MKLPVSDQHEPKQEVPSTNLSRHTPEISNLNLPASHDVNHCSTVKKEKWKLNFHMRMWEGNDSERNSSTRKNNSGEGNIS